MKYKKLSLIALLAVSASSATFAQFGGLLNNIKNQVEQAQKQLPVQGTSPAQGLPTPNTPSPTVTNPNRGSSQREKWLSDPFADIPNEVKYSFTTK